jgi:hypothetical protein
MGEWITKTVDVRVLGDRSYRTLTPVIYQDDEGNVHETPAGRDTDFGSTWGIPIVSTHFDGVAQKACIRHDDDYRSGKIPRKQADKLLRKAVIDELKDQGWSQDDAEEKANSFYYGVRLFGKSSYQGKEEWND